MGQECKIQWQILLMILSIIEIPPWHDWANFRRVNHVVANILEVGVDVRPRVPALRRVFARRASGEPAHQEESVHVVNPGIVYSKIIIW